ncbi:MAG: hypothetical protein ACO3O3_12745 [Ilumatobacteraceae bacterium]
MGKPSQNELEGLQGQLAKVLGDAIADMRVSGEYNSGVLNVARQLLKDNGVLTVADQGNPLQDLAKILPFDEKDVAAQ